MSTLPKNLQEKIAATVNDIEMRDNSSFETTAYCSGYETGAAAMHALMLEELATVARALDDIKHGYHREHPGIRYGTGSMSQIAAKALENFNKIAGGGEHGDKNA